VSAIRRSALPLAAKNFERRLRVLEGQPPEERGNPADASWDCPAASPPLVLFLLLTSFTGVE
jgi:hypothetical protein